MPLNILRLNERRLHPTPHITFIKADRDKQDHAVAEEFLYRVAAICHPIAKQHGLAVTTLEEFPPNREFVGRNFNGGEVIQLVLRRHSRQGDDDGGDSGNNFLPFRTVVLVMMHELAHNVHMNHSRAFWATRNQYADEMRALWARGYTGEGMWGPGREAATGVRVGGGRELDDGDMPEHLCGGTYRSRRGRKRKPKLSWKEQKERRIAKKFGVNGQTLGEDVTGRMALQSFKGPTTKSRVAGSKRARDLRAAAALARFEKDKAEKDKAEKIKQEAWEENEELDGQTDGGDNDDEDYEDPDSNLQDATDVDGSRMKDEKGMGLIRVCEDEDRNDVHVKQEMDELQDLCDLPWYQKKASKGTSKKSSSPDDAPKNVQRNPKPRTAIPEASPTDISNKNVRSRAEAPESQLLSSSTSENISCRVCSMANEGNPLLCIACSNVLDPHKSPGAWKCKSETCQGSEYFNSADFGVCGVCGQRKQV